MQWYNEHDVPWDSGQHGDEKRTVTDDDYFIADANGVDSAGSAGSAENIFSKFAKYLTAIKKRDKLGKQES